MFALAFATPLLLLTLFPLFLLSLGGTSHSPAHFSTFPFSRTPITATFSVTFSFWACYELSQHILQHLRAAYWGWAEMHWKKLHSFCELLKLTMLSNITVLFINV